MNHALLAPGPGASRAAQSTHHRARNNARSTIMVRCALRSLQPRVGGGARRPTPRLAVWEAASQLGRPTISGVARTENQQVPIWVSDDNRANVCPIRILVTQRERTRVCQA